MDFELGYLVSLAGFETTADALRTELALNPARTLLECSRTQLRDALG